jgi:hypothetical protein
MVSCLCSSVLTTVDSASEPEPEYAGETVAPDAGVALPMGSADAPDEETAAAVRLWVL